MKAEKFLENFSHIANATNGVTRVRALVLNLACSGGLSQSNSADSSVAEMLEEITAIQTAEFNSRETKELRSLRSPFVSGQNYYTVNLGHITRVISGQHLRPDDYTDVKTKENVPYITGPAEFGTLHPTPNKWTNVTRAIAFENDVLITVKGSGVGKPNICNFPRLAISRQLMAVRALGQLNPDFLWICLNSAQPVFQEQKMGIAIPGIGRTDVLSLEVRLPPPEEQKRIVEKVDELMKLCDELERQQQERSRLLPLLSRASHARLAAHPTPTNLASIFTDPPTLSPDDMRKTILSLAVRGRIVEQHSTDEPADVLLARIKKSTTKTKRRNLSKAGTYAQPFSLPRGWAWAKLPELGTFGRGKSRHRPRNDPRLYADGTCKLVQTGDVARSQGTINTFTNKYNPFGLKQSKLWPKGTMCIAIAANIADTGILGFEACIPDSVVGFIPSEEFPSVRYFEYFMRTMKTELEKFAPATAQKNINLGILEKVWVPIPPAKEQERIVAKVDKLMELVDEIELKRSEANQCGEQFAQIAVASITGTEIKEQQDMKAPKTELVTGLIAEGKPKKTDNAPLATILAKSKSEVSAKELWQESGLEIDAFYSQLKTEMNNGWITEPKKGFMKEVEPN